MVADVARFTQAVDEAFRSFSAEDVQIDPVERKQLGDRAGKKHIEQRYQQLLYRARCAFLQEFRNHSAVMNYEVNKIREELTERFEEAYGEKIATLKQAESELTSKVQKQEEELAELNRSTSSQQADLAAARHRCVAGQSEIKQLQVVLEETQTENKDLAHQLACRNDLVEKLGTELSTLEAELKRQASSSAEERRTYEEGLRDLRDQMRQQEDTFRSQLLEYKSQFTEFRDKTSAELQIQSILNNRRSEALAHMEEERQRHIQARTKPTPRIGLEQEGDDGRFQPYDLARGTRYHVDGMGHGTAWRDFRNGDASTAPAVSARRRQLPKFKADGLHCSGQAVIAATASSLAETSAGTTPRRA